MRVGEVAEISRGQWQGGSGWQMTASKPRESSSGGVSGAVVTRVACGRGPGCCVRIWATLAGDHQTTVVDGHVYRGQVPYFVVCNAHFFAPVVEGKVRMLIICGWY